MPLIGLEGGGGSCGERYSLKRRARSRVEPELYALGGTLRQIMFEFLVVNVKWLGISLEPLVQRMWRETTSVKKKVTEMGFKSCNGDLVLARGCYGRECNVVKAAASLFVHLERDLQLMGSAEQSWLVSPYKGRVRSLSVVFEYGL